MIYAARPLAGGGQAPLPASSRRDRVLSADVVGPAKPSLVRISLLPMTSVTNINDVLEGHVGLDLSCIDRLYLNAYVPNMAVGGSGGDGSSLRIWAIPIPSPALLQKIGNRFRRDVKAFAEENDIPILHLKKPDRSRWDDRKLDHVRPFLDQAEAEGRFGVVAIVQAQEFQWVFSGKEAATRAAKLKRFDFIREERRVGHLLLLRARSRVRAGFHQDRHLLPLSDQGVPVD